MQLPLAVLPPLDVRGRTAWRPCLPISEVLQRLRGHKF